MRRVADPSLDSGVVASGWRAQLDLGYRRLGERTVLTKRVHTGPLVVQKSLYPEGDAVCQNVIVHPPGGIVGGDALAVNVDAGPCTHVQLTTPGAAKCYRSGGAFARQRIGLRAVRGAVLEWLPQETIIFDASKIELELSIELFDDARFLGWDVVCLGRTAAGERFDHGALRQRLTLTRDGIPVFAERAVLNGGAPLLRSPVGLHGNPVFGTFLVAAPIVTHAMLESCRQVSVMAGEGAVTRLPGVVIARYRGASAAAARHYFVDLWRKLRPALALRAAVPPRIWAT
ncbi:MAG: urease accessory protein [Betaproteobacteria bacterium]|nr:MAG: urease accessory protein [Betaproteobacteria bacterium]